MLLSYREQKEEEAELGREKEAGAPFMPSAKKNVHLPRDQILTEPLRFLVFG